MSFFKHVGECNGKKVVIVQRQLPGEDHMAGVIYSEIIPSRFHDDLMKVLESTEGQQANEFKDVLTRRYFANGENMLEALHTEGFIKKAASNNIIVRPNSKSAVRLDELNKLLMQIRSGQVAQDELQQVVNEKVNPQITDAVTQIAPDQNPSQPDVNSMMMQMMQTMQQMQAELNALKGDKPVKKSNSKTEKSA